MPLWQPASIVFECLCYIARVLRRIQSVSQSVNVHFCVGFLYDSCQISYLDIHRTDLYQISRVGRTVAVDGQFELLFVFSRDVATATNFCWFSSTELTGSRWTQATSGAAGRANVGLSLYLHLVALDIVDSVQEWHSAGSRGWPFPMLKYK